MKHPVQDQLKRPLHDLRLSVIDRCNFRCPYCMPAEQYPERYPFFSSAELLQFDEIERLVRLLTQLGASKLRLTGGEPLLRKDLPALVSTLAKIDGIDDLAMSTNGVLLPRHAAALRESGLRRVTVSLDSIHEEEFMQLSGQRGSLAEVLAGIESARMAGFDTIKVNAVVKRNVNNSRILDLVEHFRGTPVTVRFIEFMDVGTLNDWQRDEVVSSTELRDRIAARWPLEPVSPDYRGEVAERYRFLDGQGQVGFISSVSAPFCRDCTRARLSADGKLFTCLFAATGLDLREPLRAGASDEQLAELLSNCWRQRHDRYSEERNQLKVRTEPVEMFKVGG